MAELLRSLLFVYTAVHTQEVRHNHRKCSKNFVHNSSTPTVGPAYSGGIFNWKKWDGNFCWAVFDDENSHFLLKTIQKVFQKFVGKVAGSFLKSCLVFELEILSLLVVSLQFRPFKMHHCTVSGRCLSHEWSFSYNLYHINYMI